MPSLEDAVMYRPSGLNATLSPNPSPSGTSIN